MWIATLTDVRFGRRLLGGAGSTQEIPRRKLGPGPGPRASVLEDSTSQHLTTLPVFAVFGCASAHPPAAVVFFGRPPSLPPVLVVFVCGFALLSGPLQGGVETRKIRLNPKSNMRGALGWGNGSQKNG